MEKNLVDWIKRISEAKDELGGFAICPYAKKALEDNKIFWSFIGYEAEEYISRYVEHTNIEGYEVIVFYNLSKNLTNDDCTTIVNNLNKKFDDVIFLKDHPNSPGYIAGLYTGNGEYPIILAQPKDKLIEARNKLRRTKYYRYWSQEYKKEIWGYGNES
jgi:hypothetical protein